MNTNQTPNPDQQNPCGEPAGIDHKALLCKIRRDLFAITPTAENGIFFIMVLELLHNFPAAFEPDAIQAAVQMAHEQFARVRVIQNSELKASLRSTMISRGELICKKLEHIELQLARPDLTRSEQLALKKQQRPVLHELVLRQLKVGDVLASDYLNHINVPAKGK